jgi:hypothetical protein
MKLQEKSRDGAFDFTDNARPSVPFDEEFIEFLGKALVPSFSDNVSTNRTDILIEDSIFGTQDNARNILDVCCGRPLLLEKLIQELTIGRQDEKPYHYVGCDRDAADDSFRDMWRKLDQQAESVGFKTSCAVADASDPDSLVPSLRRYHSGSFDIIYFANALHEITPSAIPSLLFTLVELLAKDGILIVLDPDPTWLMNPKRWEDLQELSQLAIDWEAKAVWLPQSTYKGILEDFGCSVNPRHAERSQEFWVLYVRQGPSFDPRKRKELVANAAMTISDAINTQLQEQNQRVISCRLELIEELKRVVRRDKRRIRTKGMEFFCLSASQARRVDANLEIVGP